jgi:hypothetical protein
MNIKDLDPNKVQEFKPLNISDLDPNKIQTPLNLKDLDPTKVYTEEVDDSFLGQVVKGASTPFVGSSKKAEYSPEAMANAKKYLKATAYSPESGMNTARAILGGAADAATAGFSEEIMGLVSQISGTKMTTDEVTEMLEAAGSIVREDHPIASVIGEMGGYIATAFTPIGLGGKAALAAKAGIGAAQATGSAVSKSHEDALAETISRSLVEESTAIVGGAVLGRLFTAGKRVATKGYVEKVLNDAGYDSAQAKVVAKTFKEQKEHYDDTIKTIKDLSDSQAQTFRKVLLDGINPEDYRYGDLPEALDDYKSMLARQEAVLAAGVDPIRLNKIASFFIDAQYVGDAVDRRWGTSFMREMNNTATNFNNATHLTKALKTKADKVLKQFKVKDTESKDLIKNIEAGVRGPKEDAFRTVLRELGDDVNKATNTNAVSLRDNYVPHHTKPAPELRATIRNRITSALKNKSPVLDDKDIRVLRADTELMDSIRYLGRFRRAVDIDKMKARQAEDLKSVSPKDYDSVLKIHKGELARAAGTKDQLTDEALKDFLPSFFGSNVKRIFTNTDFLDLSASSLKQRLHEDVPDLIREYDIAKLMGNWADSIPQDIMMRGSLRKIKSMALSLKAKDSTASEYMTNYVNDLGGVTRGAAGIFKEIKNEYSTKMYVNKAEAQERAIVARASGNSKAEAKYLKQAKRFDNKAKWPQFAQYLQAQMYPWFLGGRVDAPIRNMTQPYTYTIPQISLDPTYQARLASMSGWKAVEGIRDGDAFKELVKRNLVPADPTPGAFDALSHGLKSTRSVGAKATEGINNFAMWMYQRSDIANRIVTVSIGKNVAADVLTNNPHALGYINRLPSSYRREAIMSIKSNNKEALEDIIIEHLNATTQFNYNRASMSEYGRFMGSVFSMFSKWPTSITGDIVNSIDAARLSESKDKLRFSKDMARLSGKYLGPLMGLTMMDAIADRVLGADSERKKLTYGTGLAKSAPITSATAILSDPSRSMVPPAFSVISDMYKAAGVLIDPKDAKSKVLKYDTPLGIVPGGILVKTLDRIDTFINN